MTGIEEAASDESEGKVIVALVNVVADACSNLRAEARGAIDPLLITALVTFAGCVFGELQELFGVDDVSDEAIAALMVRNFRHGVTAGKARCAAIAAESETRQ